MPTLLAEKGRSSHPYNGGKVTPSNDAQQLSLHDLVRTDENRGAACTEYHRREIPSRRLGSG